MFSILTLVVCVVFQTKSIDLQPSGPIYLTEGDPIEIPCKLDDTENYTIDDLELLFNRKSLPSEIIVSIGRETPASGCK